MTSSEPMIDAAGEDTVDAFVERFNAHDFDGLAELFTDDVSSTWFEVVGRDGVVERVAELADRNPGLLLTRGELGDDPVAVTWRPDEAGSYLRLGIFTCTCVDVDGEAFIEHLEYDDDPAGADLVAEEPDPDDLPEGGAWQEWDSGED